MRVSVLLKTTAMVALISLAACGKRPGMRPVPVLPPECKILPLPSEVADSITVALTDAVEPNHAPRARNASEQLLFHHLYETLITIDCLGDVQPGLAVFWNREEGGRRWTFELREDARFWDGTPVFARDILRSWQHAAVESWIQDAGIDSVTIAGERMLHVYFQRSHRKVPRVLSAPAFSVAKTSRDSYWPLGSGPYRIVKSVRKFAGMSKRTITAQPAYGMKSPVILFRETSTYDARDLLDDGIDVMVTANPAVIEYAAGRLQLATIALSWDQTYVLLSTSRVQELRWDGTLGTISPELLDGLARDAVRSAARGYRSPSWWDDLRNCSDLSAPIRAFSHIPQGAHSSSGLRRILYEANDGIARDLAERIVALAATDPAASSEALEIASAIPGLISNTSGMIADGVTRSKMTLSLQNGDDFAYIVAIPRRPPDPCAEARRLISRAPWLASADIDLSKVLIPLVDTSQHVIANSSRVGLIADWYGNILILNKMLRGR